ncbi:hypothetical protein LOTGIDRAFT_164009 [Lottia gigantea]|uniref:C-type lectin domain-containing protein n=1 Tax=Lottia gigantea TaxID=225164 RepID=V3ZGT2_LOTGI|nr:hypothetical protein LOTGIDRAFT_164009 [Lottia gigantea]ESO90428.1 hypothetical protein LOTGIDRAFT_164009 [Lottia gigantea]
MVAIQDGVCYCLNPRPTLPGFGEQINLPSVYSRTPEVCISKGYQSLPDLGICVKYFTFKATWTDAKDHCNQDGGYLINLNTDKKYTTIMKMTANSEDLPHIGGFTDSFPDFKWTRGGSVDTQQWGLGEPNGHGTEKCLAISQIRRGFVDSPCHRSYYFICEILF